MSKRASDIAPPDIVQVGPELEIPGYGCEDHFSEHDTIDHSWEVLATLLREGYTDDLLVDFGMPVMHRGVRYNCRVFALDRRVLLIRPKLFLANDGNYRETRHFSTWKHPRSVEDHELPVLMRKVAGQARCTFGDAVLVLRDATLASETCEELFTPASPHAALSLAGVEIVSNGSGSHHVLRKLQTRLKLMQGCTRRAGGVYLYANQQGCDGGRLYYDGCACVVSNGEVLAQGSQFSLHEVEVVTATVDLDAVVSYRGAVSSLQDQASRANSYPTVKVDYQLCHPEASCTLGGLAPAEVQNCCNGVSPARAPSAAPAPSSPSSTTPAPSSPGSSVSVASKRSSQQAHVRPTAPRPPLFLLPEEEIARGPAAWLWDYLRRSGAGGFLLPLSGGADSAATAAIVASMCQMAVSQAGGGDQSVVRDVRRLARLAEGDPLPTPKELAGKIFLTLYMGTSNSSATTRRRAAAIAGQIGAQHIGLDIDGVVGALTGLFQTVTGKKARYRSEGGQPAENLALQNIQARLRMVVAFLFAQLWPWTHGWSGFLLVLGSANVDEALRGYLTKYDCSAADINPIGGISKLDLRRFLIWAADKLRCPALLEVARAEPSAELEPLEAGESAQTDEADMGMTYEELSVYGRLRKLSRLGPVGMFRDLLLTWRGLHPPRVIASKVKHFFTHYAINRHKTTVLTPSYHAEDYSPDDNRYDHRPFLYNVRWPWQFSRIDKLADECEEAAGTK